MSDDKKPSGAANRRARREREADEDEAHGMRRPEYLEAVRAAVEDLGPSPGKGAAGVVAWAQALAARIAYLTLLDESLPLGERFRRSIECVKAVGLTTAKAVTDEHIVRLMKREGPGKVEAARRRARDLAKRDEAPGSDGLDDLDAPPAGATAGDRVGPVLEGPLPPAPPRVPPEGDG